MGEAGGKDNPTRARLIVFGLTALLAVPLVVALVAQRDPPWTPMSDHAEYEMYVRDVTSTHPPLVGLTGRMQGYGEPGAHPGPIGFYLLSPVYRLLGSDGWSLQAATATLVAVATGLSIWLGHRRGGWPLALATGASLALLMWGYGSKIMIETWNPHLPLVWWMVLLLAAWSVLCDDLKLLPLVVLAGSMCAQTHVPYVPLVGGLTLLVVGTLAVRFLRSRAVDDDEEGQRSRRRLLAWTGGSAVLAGVLWLPPLVEEIRNSPGNLSIIVYSFRHNQDERVPFGGAVRMWLEHFDVTAIVTGDLPVDFPFVGLAVNWIGILVLATWVGAAVLAWRRGDAVLRRLHVVVGVTVLLSLLSMSRITGPPWPYLTYWAWGTTALLTFATIWTFLAVGAAKVTGHATDIAATATALPGRPSRLPRSWLRPTGAVLGATTLLLVGLSTVEAADVEMTESARSRTLTRLVRPTVDWLQQDPDRCDDDCRVLVAWTDDANGGMQALGLLVALEREGIDARMGPELASHVRSHRTSPPSATDLEMRLVVTDASIRAWDRRSETELVASTRPTDQRADPVAVFARPVARSAQNEPAP